MAIRQAYAIAGLILFTSMMALVEVAAEGATTGEQAKPDDSETCCVIGFGDESCVYEEDSEGEYSYDSWGEHRQGLSESGSASVDLEYVGCGIWAGEGTEEVQNVYFPNGESWPIKVRAFVANDVLVHVDCN